MSAYKILMEFHSTELTDENRHRVIVDVKQKIKAALQAELDAGKAPLGECTYCDSLRAQGETFHPSHNASPRCESGKRNHCTCDTCF